MPALNSNTGLGKSIINPVGSPDWNLRKTLGVLNKPGVDQRTSKTFGSTNLAKPASENKGLSLRGFPDITNPWWVPKDLPNENAFEAEQILNQKRPYADLLGYQNLADQNIEMALKEPEKADAYYGGKLTVTGLTPEKKAALEKEGYKITVPSYSLDGSLGLIDFGTGSKAMSQFKNLKQKGYGVELDRRVLIGPSKRI
jgi:hypothetical protein